MTILLTGGTGKTTSRLAQLLNEDGVPILLASRSGSAPDGLKSCRFNWFDDTTYEAPFMAASDISALYIVAPDTLDMFSATKPFIDYALKKGVKRFVLLSASPIESGGPGHGKIHEYIQSLNVEYGVLRPTWFMQNFSEGEQLGPIREGKIFSATGDGKIPFVSAEDIARVAQRLFTDEKPHDTDYLVLGPELLSYEEASYFLAKILSERLGKSVEHVKLSGEEAAQWLQSKGVPAEMAKLLSHLEVQIGDTGAEERLNTAVQDVTGKEPIHFRAFAEANKHVWL